MNTQPHLNLKSVTLRPFVLDDAMRVSELANCEEIAGKLSSLPYPYHVDDAKRWIKLLEQSFEDKTHISYAITIKNTGELIGEVSLRIDWKAKRAQLGYWIGKDYWNKGYGYAAALGMVDFGFTYLNLHKIFAIHYSGNPASGRILRKIGMEHEGTLVDHVYVNGHYENVEHMAIIRWW